MKFTSRRSIKRHTFTKTRPKKKGLSDSVGRSSSGEGETTCEDISKEVATSTPHYNQLTRCKLFTKSSPLVSPINQNHEGKKNSLVSDNIPKDSDTAPFRLTERMLERQKRWEQVIANLEVFATESDRLYAEKGVRSRMPKDKSRCNDENSDLNTNLKCELVNIKSTKVRRRPPVYKSPTQKRISLDNIIKNLGTRTLNLDVKNARKRMNREIQTSNVQIQDASRVAFLKSGIRNSKSAIVSRSSNCQDKNSNGDLAIPTFPNLKQGSILDNVGLSILNNSTSVVDKQPWRFENSNSSQELSGNVSVNAIRPEPEIRYPNLTSCKTLSKLDGPDNSLANKLSTERNVSLEIIDLNKKTKRKAIKKYKKKTYKGHGLAFKTSQKPQSFEINASRATSSTRGFVDVLATELHATTTPATISQKPASIETYTSGISASNTDNAGMICKELSIIPSTNAHEETVNILPEQANFDTGNSNNTKYSNSNSCGSIPNHDVPGNNFLKLQTKRNVSRSSTSQNPTTKTVQQPKSRKGRKTGDNLAPNFTSVQLVKKELFVLLHRLETIKVPERLVSDHQTTKKKQHNSKKSDKNKPETSKQPPTKNDVAHPVPGEGAKKETRKRSASYVSESNILPSGDRGRPQRIRKKPRCHTDNLEELGFVLVGENNFTRRGYITGLIKNGRISTKRSNSKIPMDKLENASQILTASTVRENPTEQNVLRLEINDNERLRSSPAYSCNTLRPIQEHCVQDQVEENNSVPAKRNRVGSKVKKAPHTKGKNGKNKKVEDTDPPMDTLKENGSQPSEATSVQDNPNECNKLGLERQVSYPTPNNQIMLPTEGNLQRDQIADNTFGRQRSSANSFGSLKTRMKLSNADSGIETSSQGTNRKHQSGIRRTKNSLVATNGIGHGESPSLQDNTDLDTASNHLSAFPAASTIAGSDVGRESDFDQRQNYTAFTGRIIDNDTYNNGHICRLPPREQFRKLENIHVHESVKNPDNHISAGYIRLESGDEKQPNVGNKFNFVYNVVSGTAEIQLDDKWGMVAQGDFFYVPRGRKYSFRSANSQELVLFYVRLKVAKE